MRVAPLLPLGFVALLFAAALPARSRADDVPVETKIVDTMNAIFGKHPGMRANHAKGAVFEGTFTPSPAAASLTSAVHMQSTPTPITVRLSNSGGLPDAPDTHPSALTRGIAIKFHLPDGSETDLLCISLPVFPVATGEDFLALLQAVAASGPNAPKPTPSQTLLASHADAAKVLSTPQPVPVSYATQRYSGIDAFKMTNAKGDVHFVRYRLMPEAGEAYLSDEEAAKRPPNALADDMRARVTAAPVKFKLLAQVAESGDPVADPSKAWPDARKLVELGEISINKVVPDSLAAEKPLLFLPTNLTPGIEASDDPLINVRTNAYAVSFSRRSQ